MYDPVGGALAEAGLRSLRDDGQLLDHRVRGGEIPRLPANQILLRNRRVTGVDWGGWVGGHQAENEQLLADVVAAIGRGELHPVEPTAYALDDVAVALQDQLDRKVTGKSVLVPYSTAASGTQPSLSRSSEATRASPSPLSEALAWYRLPLPSQ